MKKIGDGGVAQSVRASLKAAKSNHKVDSLMPILGIITELLSGKERKFTVAKLLALTVGS